MSRWSFALGRRWFGYLALVVVFAVACVLLGQWQFARREEALAAIGRIEQNYDAAPRPLSEVLSDRAAFDESQEWTPVLLRGEYLRDQQLLVRGRPYGGNAGFEVLTPFLLDDGGIFVVDRGWVPGGQEQDAPDFVPEPPSGTVTVEARLKPSEPTLPGRSAPAGQIATIHLSTVAALLDPGTYTGAYGRLVSESPRPADAPPLAAPKPAPDEGPHLSYALQWLLFALFGFFGLGYALRTEYRLLNAEDPEEMRRAERRVRRERARAPSDDAIEDAIVEAAGRR